MTSGTINVLLLGAGPINFSSTEGPWNHVCAYEKHAHVQTKRLEILLGRRLQVVGLVDMNLDRAEQALKAKKSNPELSRFYAQANIFSSVEEAGSSLQEESTPDLVIDGFPPIARGSTQAGRDNELRLIKLFPNAAFLIEKPISIGPVGDVKKVKVALQGRIVSVGYMLRYLKAVQHIKRCIRENNLTVMLTIGRYLLPYAYAADTERNKCLAYWDKTKEQGPVVSQGTHIVDLIRYLSAEALSDTLSVRTVEHSDAAGRLSLLSDEAAALADDKKIARVTNAIWQTESGGTVNFIHGIALHEGDYDCELVVIADGWRFTLKDPYTAAPYLLIRHPGSPLEETMRFPEDDCYYTEFEMLVGVIDGTRSSSDILSPYEDAVKTYKLTWDITAIGQQSYDARRTKVAC